MPQLQSAKRLREERAPLAKKIRENADLLSAEKRDFTPEERTNWEKLNADYDALSRQIEILERADEVDAAQLEREKPNSRKRDDRRSTSGGNDGKPRLTRAERAARSEENYEAAMKGWMRRQLGMPLTKRQARAARELNLRPNSRHFDIPLKRDYSQVQREFRSQDFQAVGGGAALIPTGFVNRLEKALLAYNGVRQSAEVIRTDTGEELPWPTVNDTGNKGERLPQAKTVGTQDATFGQISWRAYKYSSKMIQVPAELLQDSAFDLSVWLADLLGERIGRIQNDDFTTGDAASKPNGIVTASTLGVTTAANNAIAYDDVIKLEHSIDPAYRQPGQCGYMMNDQIKLQTRLLKDSYGRYMWGSGGLNNGAPDTLNDWPFVINQSMASAITASATVMLFGVLSKYKIRDVGVIRMKRLVERYADQDLEGFIGFQRSDGNLLDAGTHPIKSLVMHA